jgi:hypothetical protein
MRPALHGPVPTAARLGAAPTIREQQFSAYDGRLVGRPDVVRDREVVDYKSGGIFEQEEGMQADVVKAAYVRQVRIYGYLVRQALGWWPRRGLILPLAGAGVEVALEPAECEREAFEAVSRLESYNAKVQANKSPAALGAPSPVACKWCPYKLLCPAFWQNADPTWSGQLDGAAIAGTLAESPRVIHSGAALAISLDVQAGSEAGPRTDISPFNPAVHNSVASMVAGEQIRVVGLRIRTDKRPVPTQRTVLARVINLPQVNVVTVRQWREQHLATVE